MKITGATVWQLDLPLRKPYWLSGGRLKFEVLDSTVLRLETDSGQAGWGEGCPWGVSYLPAHGRGIRAAFEVLIPAVIGTDPRQLDALNRCMDLALPGHLYAKSAIDMAAHDIAAQWAGLPLCEFMGAREPHAVPLASSISTGSVEEMLDDINRYRDLGYRVHSCKIGEGVAQDIERVERLTAAQRQDEVIYFDANRAWLPREAMVVMNAVSAVPSWFEQPCETLEQVQAVRQQTTAPICIDENLHTFDDLRRIQRDGIGEIVNIKINRVGGLTRARQMRDFCLASGLSMLVMDTGGSVLADTAAAHLAQTIPAAACLGSWSCQEMLTVDPAPSLGARHLQGGFHVPEEPGLGVSPELSLLGEPFAVYSG